MENDVAQVVEALPSSCTTKAHCHMCSELLQLVHRISTIFPEIEAARPRCSSGIEALSLLSNGISKAKSLIQHCNEASKLYLAITGDSIRSRCNKSRNLLEQNLTIIQFMVPVLLVAKISGIIADLRSATFHLDPYEEEAGKLLKELLYRSDSLTDSTEEPALAALEFACLRLHITSQKALLIEKRSIRMLLDKFAKDEPNKRKILLFFLNLLNKYGKMIVKDNKDPFLFAQFYDESGEIECPIKYRPDEAHIGMLSRAAPPKAFVCPLSFRLMYDPVIISSGITYERMWIRKWFDEGHDSCPKTKEKLAHLSLTSNTVMKNLISKWCADRAVSIPDPSMQVALIKSWETSSNSIASLSSSLNDLHLPFDFSNISHGSIQDSDVSHAKITNDVDLKPTKSDDGFHILHFSASARQNDMERFCKFNALPWDSQCLMVKNMTNKVIPSGNFVQPLLRFLKDAHDLHDVDAQISGCLLLLALLQNNRDFISFIDEDAYGMLTLFLDTEVVKEALAILGVVSSHQQCEYQSAASSILASVLDILDLQTQELLEPALKILRNWSLNSDIGSSIVPSEFIPKLVPLFEDDILAKYIGTILKNLCENEDARVVIAETDGCISCMARLLENDCHEDQEHAVFVLHSLCSQHVEYCHLVMDEGVIPDLVSISVNGNEKAKAMAQELLQILKDKYKDIGDCSASDFDVCINSTKPYKETYAACKAPGIWGKLFLRRGSLVSKKQK